MCCFSAPIALHLGCDCDSIAIRLRSDCASFLCVATVLHLRYVCAATALRLRCVCAAFFRAVFALCCVGVAIALRRSTRNFAQLRDRDALSIAKRLYCCAILQFFCACDCAVLAFMLRHFCISSATRMRCASAALALRCACVALHLRCTTVVQRLRNDCTALLFACDGLGCALVLVLAIALRLR